MENITDQIAYLSTLISDNKREKIKHVLENRTDYITVALENIEQPHNASAVMRTCDIFGVQDLHVIEEHAQFTPQNTVTKGASKWLDLYSYGSTKACIKELKAQGYRIVATTPHERGYSLTELPIKQKTALLFGTEVTGLSDQALELADDFVTIDMFGFTESFNISVSAALCLHHLIAQVHKSNLDWRLPRKKRDEIELSWLKKILHMVR